MALEEALRHAANELQRLQAPFALVGGLAVAVRAEPRLTRDADLAVSVTSDGEAEALVADLAARGYHVLALVEHEALGRLATVRLTRTAQPTSVVVDLLFASSGIEPEVVAAADEIAVLPTLLVPVATVGHLLALKVLARDDRQRPTDADDLRALAAVAAPEDWATAEAAVHLIASRGCARGRDLPALLEQVRTRGAY
jgi:hypothetical protein